MLVDLLPRARRTSFLELEGSALVGRDRELADLGEAVFASRLVTLVGEAGVGKTRLALRFAAAQRAAYGSVWFCDLRDARDVEAMSAALARTLSIADEATVLGDAAATAVGRALAARGRTLLVLDNIEQLLPAGAAVVLTWLDLARDAHIVVTSREPLYLLGEELLELAPLPLHDGGAAVALFVERVRAFREDFVPSGDDARAIAAVVRRVRGVPLAIELCASRFSPGDVRPLGLRGPAPVEGHADPIEWSFCKLDPLEREALAQCSVFRGGFTFEAAERVVELSSPSFRPMPRRIGGVLAMLLQKSLIQPIRSAHEGALPRFALCEGMRGHAAGLLDQSVEASGAGRGATRSSTSISASGPLTDLPVGAGAPAETRDQLAAERDNLEAVLAFGASRGRRDIVRGRRSRSTSFSSGTGIAGDAGVPRRRSLDERQPRSGHGGARARRACRRAAGAGPARRGRARRADGAGAGHPGGQRAADCRHAPGGGRRPLPDGRPRARAGALARRGRGGAQRRVPGGRVAGAAADWRGAPGDGDPAGARAHYEGALDSALDSEDAVAEARAAAGLGSYHLEAGELERAEVSYARALLIARRLGMTRNARIVMGYLWRDAPRRRPPARGGAVPRQRRTGFAREQAILRIEGIFEGIRGAVLASLDLVDEARSAFALAHQLLAANPYLRCDRGAPGAPRAGRGARGARGGRWSPGGRPGAGGGAADCRGRGVGRGDCAAGEAVGRRADRGEDFAAGAGGGAGVEAPVVQGRRRSRFSAA